MKYGLNCVARSRVKDQPRKEWIGLERLNIPVAQTLLESHSHCFSLTKGEIRAALPAKGESAVIIWMPTGHYDSDVGALLLTAHHLRGEVRSSFRSAPTASKHHHQVGSNHLVIINVWSRGERLIDGSETSLNPG